MLVRLLALLLALLALGAGGFGVALDRAPKHPAVKQLRQSVASAAEAAGSKGKSVESAVAAPAAYGLLLIGTLALGMAVWPKRKGGADVAKPSEEEPARGVDARVSRKARKQAVVMARKGKVLEAAEFCFQSGLLDQAAEYFQEANQLVRAAEIRHDQNRSEEAAALYVQAGQQETAGRIYAAMGDHERAAECYRKTGSNSVAAEMFEKAGQHLRAGEAYAESGFHRHAAQAFLRVEQWVRAAKSLEQVIVEENTPAAQHSPEKQQEIRKIVLQAGKLYERAGDLPAAERVLEKGGCFAAAGEVAQRLEHHAKAAELFLAANDPPRAAEALLSLGEQQAAARILGEHHRDRGEDQDAARYFLEAGEYLEAGDLFRKLEDGARAADCYERAGDRIQAAEMFALAGEVERAAENFQKSGHFEEAAACWERAGDFRKQAALLEKAGLGLRAGQVLSENELHEEAIKVLQQVGPDSADFATASAMLGEIFHSRGQHGLAVAKLKQAIGDADLCRENLDAYYRLATVNEAHGELREAVSVYERILAFDYHYADVEERLGAARDKLQLMSSPGVTGGSLSQSIPPQTSRPGRYQVEGELGRGGMGIVYKARDTVLDRIVAFKVLPDAFKENPQALRNFLREAKSAAKLNHPNIVTVYDAGEQEGVYYIAMEYVDGTTLKEIVRRKGAVAPNGVLHVLVQMCEALRYAHDQKVVHRDIKTANTMWTREKKAKIMDFGLAKVVEEVRNHTTLVSGTPYYMSPEQTLGKNIDHRTDIYSLGVTIFELCSGTLPFREGNVPYHHVHTPAPDVREVAPEVPALIANIIARCMQKDPAARYQTTREILAELKQGLARRNA